MTSWQKKLARWRRSRFGGGSQPSASADVRTLIANSGLFDAAWYLERYPDVANSGVDPLDHYVNHGGAEGRKASPLFDSRWYSQNYADVGSSGLHPMVHFLQHGQGRETTKRVGLKGVKTRPEDFAAAEEILASPLFDAQWYARDHGLETDARTAALHYLKIGASMEAPAGPNFDTGAYLRAYGDVADAGVNPLLHFLRHGQAEGRRAFPLISDGGMERPRGARAAPAFFSGPLDELPVADAEAWIPSHKLAAVPGLALVRLQKVRIGLLPEVYDDWTAPLPQSLARAIKTFRDLAGLDDTSFVAAKNGRRNRRISPVGGAASSGEHLLSDAWLVSDHRLRLRLTADTATSSVVRVLQVGDDRTVTLVGEGLVATRTSILDVRLLSPFRPLLLVQCDEHGELQAGSILPFPSLCRGGPHHAETISSSDSGDAMEKQAALSARLLRDSLGWNDAPPPKIGSVVVDLRGATGGERIFTSSALRWLSDLGVSISGIDPSQEIPAEAAAFLKRTLEQSVPTPAPRGSDELTIPCDALPTLTALMQRSPFPSEVSGQYLVAEAVSCNPVWLVSPPAEINLERLQPTATPIAFPRVRSRVRRTTGVSGRAGSLAVRFRRKVADDLPTSLYPVAPEQPVFPTISPAAQRGKRVGISAIVRVRDVARAAGLLESLARQTVADRVHVVAAVSTNDDASVIPKLLSRLFPDHHTIVSVSGLGLAGAWNGAADIGARHGDHLLFVDDTKILHDRRTLEALERMSSTPGTASASCVQIVSRGFKGGSILQVHSGGLFPTHVSLNGGPSVVFSTPDVRDALGTSTYAVASNDAGLMMVPTSIWSSLGGFDADRFPHETHDLDFCLRALQAGFANLCTAATTVADLEDSIARSRNAPMDLMTFGELAKLLDRVTVLRALI